MHPMPDKTRNQCYDVLRPLLFAIWDSSALKSSVCEVFKLSSEIIQIDFSIWLRNLATGRVKILNMHFVALWIYAGRTGQTWYSK
jgi:hypothetical protein